MSLRHQRRRCGQSRGCFTLFSSGTVRERRGVIGQACRAAIEGLEERRLLSSGQVHLIGITGNQQNPDFPDETLFDIAYGASGTTDPRFLDGFSDIASDAPDTVLSAQTSVGVTQGLGALRVDVPQGQSAFWGFNSGNIAAALAGGATSLSYDMTLNNIELNGGSFSGGTDDSFNGFAQSNQLAVVINTPSGGFIQRDFTAGGATDTSGQSGAWNGIDGQRTITWDLTKFTSGGMSLADFITANNATDARLWFVTQGGDTNGNAGPMRFYFDNVALHGPAGDQTIGSFELFRETPLVRLPFVPDTDAIGFNPETGLLHRTSGASAYRNNPAQVGYNDNQFMETVDLFSPGLPQAGVFNANYQGDGANGPYGLPAPRQDWLLPFDRRTDEQTDPSFRQQGPNEYSAARDLTWSSSEHLFYVVDDTGIFKLTADGHSTLVGKPTGLAGGPKGITFFTINGERKLLVSERDGPNLYIVDPTNGQVVGNPITVTDSFLPLPGVLSLVESPDGSTLLGIAKNINDPNNAFARKLVQIDPVTGEATELGTFDVHMADLAFVVAPPVLVTATQFTYDALPQALKVTFNRDIDANSLSPSDLSVRRAPADPPFSATGVSYDAVTRTATFTFGAAALADGDYLATLAAGSVLDFQGNPLTDASSSSFFFLAGDVNHDRSVSFPDLVAVAQNYGKTGKTFSQGNVSYDAAGNVDFEDLVIIAQRYGVTLQMLPSAASVPIVSNPSSDHKRSDSLFNTTTPIQRPQAPAPLTRSAIRPASRK